MRGNLDDLVSFVSVGQERSFTKAAAKLGVSQSALNHTIRQVKERLGGLADPHHPRRHANFGGANASYAVSGEQVRGCGLGKSQPDLGISADDDAVRSVLWPELVRSTAFPDIKVDPAIDYA